MVVNMYTWCAVLSPIFYHLWIYTGSANANFYFALTLVSSAAQVCLLLSCLDLMYCYHIYCVLLPYILRTVTIYTVYCYHIYCVLLPYILRTVTIYTVYCRTRFDSDGLMVAKIVT